MLLSDLEWQGPAQVAFAEIKHGLTIFTNEDGTYDIWGDGGQWNRLDAFAAQSVLFELTKEDPPNE